jgi:hypothetical protein
VPWHIPLASKLKHCPPRKAAFVEQDVQSDGLGPVHVAQAALQSEQLLPDWKVPGRQVGDLTGMQAFRSVGSGAVPGAQVVHAVAEQALQPEPQDTQVPLELRKKPVSHVAHAVPLEALAHPGMQVQVPVELQVPFKQLHLDGAFEGSGVERHAPVPDGPSSHLSQLLGHSRKSKVYMSTRQSSVVRRSVTDWSNWVQRNPYRRSRTTRQ